MQWFLDNLLAPIIVGIVAIMVGLFIGTRNQRKVEKKNRIKELEIENTQLKSRIAEFEDYEKIQNSLIYNKNGFYTQKQDDKTDNFCSRCWDIDKKLVNIRIQNNGYFLCTSCKNSGIFDEQRYNQVSNKDSMHVF